MTGGRGASMNKFLLAIGFVLTWTFALLPVLVAWRRRRTITEWEHCYVSFPKRLNDGTRASGELMRRRVNGQWQYRRPTERETADEYYARQY
jgi:hypothetical protein